jgi:hypothetical protein
MLIGWLRRQPGKLGPRLIPVGRCLGYFIPPERSFSIQLAQNLDSFGVE